jgi:hypothetical protein
MFPLCGTLIPFIGQMIDTFKQPFEILIIVGLYNAVCMTLMFFYNSPIIYVMFGIGYAVRQAAFIPSILKLFVNDTDNVGMKASVIMSLKGFGILALLKINTFMFIKYDSYVPFFSFLIVL